MKKTNKSNNTNFIKTYNDITNKDFDNNQDENDLSNLLEKIESATKRAEEILESMNDYSRLLRSIKRAKSFEKFFFLFKLGIIKNHLSCFVLFFFTSFLLSATILLTLRNLLTLSNTLFFIITLTTSLCGGIFGILYQLKYLKYYKEWKLITENGKHTINSVELDVQNKYRKYRV